MFEPILHRHASAQPASVAAIGGNKDRGYSLECRPNKRLEADSLRRRFAPTSLAAQAQRWAFIQYLR